MGGAQWRQVDFVLEVHLGTRSPTSTHSVSWWILIPYHHFHYSLTPSPFLCVFFRFSSVYLLIPSLYFCFKSFGSATAHGSTSGTAFPPPSAAPIGCPWSRVPSGPISHGTQERGLWYMHCTAPFQGGEDGEGVCGHGLSPYVCVVSHVPSALLLPKAQMGGNEPCLSSTLYQTLCIYT